MTKMITKSGQVVDLLDPKPEMIHLEDIAHALGRIPRFTGHTSTPWSVADHSLLVAELVPPADRLQALLHDAHEAYIGDVSTPLKVAMRVVAGGVASPFDEIEKWLREAICERFSISPQLPHSVKRCDAVALEIERMELMPGEHDYWSPAPIDHFEARQYSRRLIHSTAGMVAWRFMDAVRECQEEGRKCVTST